MNLNRLTMGGRVVAISALLLFIDSFLPWFHKCVSFSFLGVSSVCGSHSAWSKPLSLLGILVAIAMLVQIGLELAAVDLPRLGTISWAQAQLVAAGLVFLLVGIGVAVGDSPLDRYVFGYIGLVLAIGVLVGAVMRYREAEAHPVPGHGQPMAP